MNKNLPYYFTAVLIFILLKFAYAAAECEELVFLLAPVDKLAGWLAGSKSVFIPQRGYYHEALNIIIGKGCAGHNFLLLSFLCFSYLTLKYFDKRAYKILAIGVSLAASYFLTVFVNTSRIFTAIIVQNRAESIFPNHKDLVHESIGIIINLSFLVLAYYVTEKFLEKRRVYEKSE